MHIEDLKAKALHIFSASVEAVHPQQLMEEVLLLKGTVLHISGLKGKELEIDLSEVGRIVAVGAGKAVAPMARSLEELLQERLEGGLISVKYDHGFPLDRIEVREAGHPIPVDNGQHGADLIKNIAKNAIKNDLLLCLISGGGSALLPLPAFGLTLKEKQDTIKVLLSCKSKALSVRLACFISPSLSAVPTTPLSSTAGCSCKMLSTSVGHTAWPPTFIMSSVRPAYQK